MVNNKHWKTLKISNVPVQANAQHAILSQRGGE